MIGKTLYIVLGALMINYLIVAQNPSVETKAPVFSPLETSYDFGTIGENDGFVQHIFKFTNTGTAPLVISNITASCGCTQPEWSKAPVEPGKEGFIIISYNPKGRLGPINKSATVYTNENNGFKRYNLTILGQVVEKPSDPNVDFQEMSGGMGVERNNMAFKVFNYSANNRIATYIKNRNAETVHFSWENVPDYLYIQAPDSLKADWPGEIVFHIDGPKTAEKRGRITEKCTWIIKNSQGKIIGNEQFGITINYIDDFSKLTPLQKVSAPVLDIKTTLIDFGTIKKATLGLFGGKANKPIILTNTGKSDLVIHSMNSDDVRVRLPELKGKTIKAGETFTVNATILSKEFKSEKLDTEIYVVCNDPKGPVRRIKVNAEKIE